MDSVIACHTNGKPPLCPWAHRWPSERHHRLLWCAAACFPFQRMRMLNNQISHLTLLLSNLFSGARRKMPTRTRGSEPRVATRLALARRRRLPLSRRVPGPAHVECFFQHFRENAGHGLLNNKNRALWQLSEPLPRSVFGAHSECLLHFECLLQHFRENAGRGLLYHQNQTHWQGPRDLLGASGTDEA